MESLQPTELTRRIETWLGEELEAFPETVHSVFGQALAVIEQDQWTETLIIEQIGYGTLNIPWRAAFHPNPFFDWIFRSWTLDRIRSYVDLYPVTLARSLFASLESTETDPQTLETLLFNYILTQCTEAAVRGNQEAAVALRVLYRWGLDEDLPGFNEHHDLELSQLRVNHPDGRTLVTMRDPDHGPFTRTQLSLIENRLMSHQAITAAQRTLFLLGRDWGLRPIQLALLQTTDFARDEGGPFILVPSVKGKRRSKLRRHSSNMVKRYIADDTAQAVQAQCQEAQRLVAEAVPRIQALCQAHDIPAQALPTPLFPGPNRTAVRLLRYLQNPQLAQYALHTDSRHLSQKIRSLTWILAVRNPHSKIPEEGVYMQITAYRLRRTKGTSMVLSGATPEEVAQALDHQGIHSIAHYFRYNLELQDFINRVHTASPEIRVAVDMWGGRFVEAVENNTAYRPISNLGKCSRPTPCPYHPTITCYACSSFMPSRHADHVSALEGIQHFQSMLSSASTGPMAQQVEAAVYGAKAILIAVKELS